MDVRSPLPIMKKINHLGETNRVPLELKSTINLPKTGFPMKANLPQNEPKALARWEEMGIYQRIREARPGAPIYVLHDGPPYANGPIHLGHALNKCLKDFIVKSKTMSGFDSPYVPGWDCHGLPIEIKVDQQLGGKKLQMEKLEVREACRKYAQKFLDLQREQFKRIGVFGRWDDPYSTMTPQYESVVLATFYDFLEKEFVYKGLRSVYWCIYDKTALAEAEVEYENHTSPTVWVKYRAGRRPGAARSRTRRQEGFHRHLDHHALDASRVDGRGLSSRRRIRRARIRRRGLHRRRATGRRIRRQSRAEGNEVVARFPGKKLEYTKFAHPFLDRTVLGVLADYVTMDQGTGAVHTAPSHGADDFDTGVKYKLDLTTQRGCRRHHAQRPARIRRQEGLRRQPAHRRAAEKARRADAFGKTRALLSALLALPQSHHLPRHRAVVHLHGNADGRAGPCAAGPSTKSRK